MPSCLCRGCCFSNLQSQALVRTPAPEMQNLKASPWEPDALSLHPAAPLARCSLPTGPWTVLPSDPQPLACLAKWLAALGEALPRAAGRSGHRPAIAGQASREGQHPLPSGRLPSARRCPATASSWRGLAEGPPPPWQGIAKGGAGQALPSRQANGVAPNPRTRASDRPATCTRSRRPKWRSPPGGKSRG